MSQRLLMLTWWLLASAVGQVQLQGQALAQAPLWCCCLLVR